MTASAWCTKRHHKLGTRGKWSIVRVRGEHTLPYELADVECPAFGDTLMRSPPLKIDTALDEPGHETRILSGISPLASTNHSYRPSSRKNSTTWRTSNAKLFAGGCGYCETCLASMMAPFSIVSGRSLADPSSWFRRRLDGRRKRGTAGTGIQAAGNGEHTAGRGVGTPAPE